MQPLYLLAAESSSGGLLGALGINWRSLLLNTLAFFVILLILRKFVYPALTRALDAKQDQLMAATKAEHDAKEHLSEAERTSEEIIKQARIAADDVLASAKTESTQLVDEARIKAQSQADRIVAEAHDQLVIDVEIARHALKAETAHLVAKAAESVLEAKLDEPKDVALIKRSLENVRS